MPSKRRESISRGVTVNLTSDVNLEKLMLELPKKIALKSARKAVKLAANVGNLDYQSRVPVGKTGNLKSSIMTGGKVIVKSSKKKGGYIGYVGSTWPKGAHSFLVEEGHKVVPRGPKGGPSAKGSTKQPLTGKAKVEGKYDLLKTFKATRQESQNVLVATLTKAIVDAGG